MSKAEDLLSNEDENAYFNTTDKDLQEKIAFEVSKRLKAPHASSLTANEKKELWNAITLEIENSSKVKNLKRTRYRRLAIAASLISFLFISFWLISSYESSSDTLLAAAAKNQYLLDKTDSVELRSSNNSILFESEKIINFEDYYDNLSNLTADNNEPVYSTLTVPYGKRAEIVLADGSKVWLNAGSQLTFPVKFDADKREVYLEGEAYFDITHSSESPFFVRSESFAIKVLGTTFNLSSYSEDTHSAVHLISGKISLENTNQSKFKSQILTAGTEAKLNKASNDLSIAEKIDRDVLWTKKQLLLNKTPLNEVIKKLERIYNAQIVADLDHEGAQTFSGKLNLNESLMTVLSYIYQPQNYTILESERRILVQKK